MSHPDPRRVLGVSASASAAEIRRAFRRLVLELHPDRSGASSDARLLEVVEAYEQVTGKARPTRRRAEPRSARPAPRGSRGRDAYRGRPYAETVHAARDRFNCARCNDTFAVEGECPRCGIALVDGIAGIAPAQPEVDAYIEALESRPAPPAWLKEGMGTLERRLPVTTIGTLFAGGALALTIHAPVATMMIGYGLVLLCADAVLGRAA